MPRNPEESQPEIEVEELDYNLSGLRRRPKPPNADPLNKPEVSASLKAPKLPDIHRKLSACLPDPEDQDKPEVDKSSFDHPTSPPIEGYFETFVDQEGDRLTPTVSEKRIKVVPPVDEEGLEDGIPLDDWERRFEAIIELYEEIQFNARELINALDQAAYQSKDIYYVDRVRIVALALCDVTRIMNGYLQQGEKPDRSASDPIGTYMLPQLVLRELRESVHPDPDNFESIDVIVDTQTLDRFRQILTIMKPIQERLEKLLKENPQWETMYDLTLYRWQLESEQM